MLTHNALHSYRNYLLQSAIFNFQSLLTVVLLLICTCAYVRAMFPSLLDNRKEGWVIKITHDQSFIVIFPPDWNVRWFLFKHWIFVCRFTGIFWKCARIGERKSPHVAFCCLAMAFTIVFLSWGKTILFSNVAGRLSELERLNGCSNTNNL